ncbi:MAG: hypothetical protein OEZ59_04595 [Deltaproteobacteria bacterium]|nr:hypothetical protein [Deltaproteobacteria bacterium]
MPRTVQWYVRTALACLVLSMFIGVLRQYDLWRGGIGFGPYVRVVHIHLALMGGVVQMIMGVAMWMFPQDREPSQRLPFREGPAWTAYALFNGGLFGRFAAEYLHRGGAGDVFGGLAVLTGLMQIAAVGIVVVSLWRLRAHRREKPPQTP